MVQGIFWINDPRRIRENQLKIIFCQNAFDPVAGRLDLGGYNGQFLPHQKIQQRAFACVGPTKEIDESGSHVMGVLEEKIRPEADLVAKGRIELPTFGL